MDRKVVHHHLLSRLIYSWTAGRTMEGKNVYLMHNARVFGTMKKIGGAPWSDVNEISFSASTAIARKCQSCSFNFASMWALMNEAEDRPHSKPYADERKCGGRGGGGGVFVGIDELTFFHPLNKSSSSTSFNLTPHTHPEMRRRSRKSPLIKVPGKKEILQQQQQQRQTLSNATGNEDNYHRNDDLSFRQSNRKRRGKDQSFCQSTYNQ